MSETSCERCCDESAILGQLARAARLLDRKAWADLTSVFAESVTFDYGDGSGVQSGLPAIRDNFRKHLDLCGATQHLLGSTIVTIDGDTATTEAYVQARHAGLGDLATDIFDTNGEYIDTWARDGDTWRIVHREARWLTFSGNPAVIGLGQ